MLCGPDSKRKWRGASGQQRGEKGGGILKIGREVGGGQKRAEMPSKSSFIII